MLVVQHRANMCCWLLFCVNSLHTHVTCLSLTLGRARCERRNPLTLAPKEGLPHVSERHERDRIPNNVGDIVIVDRVKFGAAVGGAHVDDGGLLRKVAKVDLCHLCERFVGRPTLELAALREGLRLSVLAMHTKRVPSPLNIACEVGGESLGESVCETVGSSGSTD